MNFIIIIIFLMLSPNLFAKDEYVIPQDVLEARDKAVNSFHSFQKKLGERYLFLLKKQELTIQELQEFKVLDLIVNEKDTTEFEKEWEKTHPQSLKKKTKIISY